MPLVSVFIPAFNCARFVGIAIESVQRQTFSDWEMIVVDDCSSDDTVEICRMYVEQDSRIRLVCNPVNLGMMPNWNKGVELCKGEFFAKLDSDDYWSDHMLEDCLTTLKADNSVGLTVSRIALMDEQGIIGNDDISKMPHYASNRSFSTVDLVKLGVHGIFRDSILKQGIGLIRRSIFDELGLFTLHPAGDTEMWFRIGAHYKIAGIDKVNYFYRIWSQSFTKREVKKNARYEQNMYETRSMIFDYYYKQGLISSSDHRQFKTENEVEFNKYRIASLKKNGDYFKAMQILARTLLIAPLQLLGYYLGRLVENVISPKK